MDRRQFLGAVLLATAGCVPAFRMTRSLTLGVTDGHTHPVTYISRSAGERKLYHIVNSLDTKLEDGWLFIESANLEKWVDIGAWQRSNEVFFDNRVVKKELRELVRSGAPSNISVYHIHHLRSVFANSKSYQPDKETLEQHHMEVFGAPGPSDIAAHINFEYNFNKYIKGSENVVLSESRVVAPTGIFTYTSTEKIKEAYEREGAGCIIRLYKRAINQGTYDKDINSMLRMLEEGGVSVKYKRSRTLPRPIHII